MSAKLHKFLGIALNEDSTERDIHNSITEFKKYILLPKGECSLKLEILEKLFSVEERVNDAIELLDSIRDVYMFPMYRTEHNKVLLDTIIASEKIPSTQRFLTCLMLYNTGDLDLDNFAIIAKSEAAEYVDRVEACIYMYGSEVDEYKKIAFDELSKLIVDDAHSIKNRYRTIVGFESKSGIRSVYNNEKVRCNYDVFFSIDLHNAFFDGEKNSIVHKSMSADFLINHKNVTAASNAAAASTDVDDTTSTTDAVEKSADEMYISQSRIDEIFEWLGSVMKDETAEETDRANCADVITRCGTKEQFLEAVAMIDKIGNSGTSSQNRTVYTNTQNVHKFMHQIDEIVEDLYYKHRNSLDDLETCLNAVSSIIRGMAEDAYARVDAYASLERIKVDKARFTSLKLTISQILQLVWREMCETEEGSDEREKLEELLMFELCDMGDNCSSGHAARLVNVLGKLQITFDDQIKASFSGRLMARMRDEEDTEIRTALVMAPMENADKEDVDVYNRYVKKHAPEIIDELREEYVTEGYISSVNFDAIEREIKEVSKIETKEQ